MSAAPSSTSTALTELVQSGDPAAWIRFVQIYQPYVYAYARRMGLQPEDAADISQEVFQLVVGNMARFQRQRHKGALRKWLRTITHNAIVSRHRLQSNRERAIGGSEALVTFRNVAADDSESSPLEMLSEERELIRRVLRMLRPDFQESTWQAFWRTTADGLPAPQVAEELGLTAKAVRQAKHRVLSKIREVLGD